MTPINFVSFLLSLYLVDCHYHDKRIQQHSERYSRLPSWPPLPAWLQRMLFSSRATYNPYDWVGGSGSGSGGRKNEVVNNRGSNRGTNPDRWYYHTQQGKLMRMEAADAFELRRAVLVGLSAVLAVLCAVGLGSVVMGAGWALWRVSVGVMCSSAR